MIIDEADIKILQYLGKILIWMTLNLPNPHKKEKYTKTPKNRYIKRNVKAKVKFGKQFGCSH